MPDISTAMRRSLRRGVGEILVNNLLRRDTSSDADSVENKITNVKEAFSSWSNCMQASFCKWPVIVVIIIGSLIILSIVTCIVRCCCCGYSCCCACFSFLKCCDCCGDSCAGKKDKPMKHLDDPSEFYPPRQGYQAPAPMMGGGLAAKPEPPQFASFEVGRNGFAVEPKAALSEDALPPMPSWETAQKRHVMEEEEKKGESVEMGELNPTTGQRVPLMAGAVGPGSSMPPSPAHDHTPFDFPGQAVGGAYSDIPAGEHYRDLNSMSPNLNGGMNGNMNGPYGGPGRPGPGPGRGGPGRGYGPRQNNFEGPNQGYGQGRGGYNGQNQDYGAPSPDQYGNNDVFSGNAIDAYGQPLQNPNNPRPFPPQPARQYSSDSSRPLNPGRQYSDRSYDNFQSGPPPPRGPSRGPGGQGRSPPLNNKSGFDFNAGVPQGQQQPQQQYNNNRSPPPQQSYNSRPSPSPQQNAYGPQGGRGNNRPPPPRQNDDYFGGGGGRTAPPSYASRSPPPLAQQEQGYPGYRAYQSGGRGEGGRGTPSAMTPGRREPDRWDPVH